MFKKDFKLTSNNQLSGKDKEKLKTQLSEQFEKDSIAHLFKTSKKIVMQKVSGSSMVIYSNENYPVFVDTSKKGDFFPTVWCCMAYPDLTVKLEIHNKVDQFIYKGANLKWPGVNKQEDIKEFEGDDVVSIVLSDQTPIAIGAMACDYEDWKDEEEETDQAAFILHHINDKLADVLEVDIEEEVEVQFSKSEELQKQKEEEEARKKELEEEEERARKQQEEDEQDEDDDIDMSAFGKKPKKVVVQQDDFEEDEQIEMTLPQKKGKNKGRQQQVQEESKEDMFEDDNPRGKKGKGKGKKGKGGGKGGKKGGNDDEEQGGDNKEAAASSGPAIPVGVMDDYIKEAFFNALKLTVDDKMLPLDPSVLLSKHMQVCKKESITIDWKNSSYKKIGKFVQVMAKDGVIEYKEGKKGSAPSITRIFRSNQELQEWQPTISRAQTKKQDDEEESKSNTDSFVLKIKVSQTYQPKSNLVTLFGDQECTKKQYSLEQIKTATMNYVKKEKLLEKKFIILDPYLANLVGNTKEEVEDDKKEGEEGEEQEEQVGKKKTKKGESQATIQQAALLKKIEANLIVGHTIQDQSGKVTTHKGKFKGLTIIAEKSHNKNVTKVQGLEPYGFNFDKLAEKFKLQFACSVSKGEITTGKKLKLKEKPDHELICHANTLDDLKDFFTLECKIPEDQITLNNKLNKGKGKGGFQK